MNTRFPIFATLLLGTMIAAPIAIPTQGPSYRGYESTFILPIEEVYAPWQAPAIDRLNQDVWIIDPYGSPETGEFFQYLRRS
jgi:hypothetical protein